MSLNAAPFTSVVLSGPYISQPWISWLTALRLAVVSSPQQAGAVALTGQSAAVTTVAVPTPTLATGRYEVRWYARITQAATTSSSLTVTIGWTDGAVACTTAGAAITGNTTATTQSGTAMIRIDNGTTITYAAAYGSVGATAMQYALDVTVEALP